MMCIALIALFLENIKLFYALRVDFFIIYMYLNIGSLVVGVKADCLTRDLSLQVECPPWGVFLKDPSPYLREFRRKPLSEKTPNG